MCSERGGLGLGCALQEHGGARGEIGERSEAVELLVESVLAVGAVGET